MIVRCPPGGIGASELIRDTAQRAGARVFDYTLGTQFRCASSDGFIRWVENTLGITRTPNVLWDPNDAFDFQIFDSPENVEAEIRQNSADGATARMVAGFCWKGSDPLHHGEWSPTWSSVGMPDRGTQSPMLGD